MSLLRRIEGPGGAVAPTPISDEPRRAPTFQLRDPARDISDGLKTRVQNRLISELDPKMDLTDTVGPPRDRRTLQRHPRERRRRPRALRAAAALRGRRRRDPRLRP